MRRWLTINQTVSVLLLTQIEIDVVHEEGRLDFATEVRLFGRWTYEGVASKDMSLLSYINVKT